MTPASLDQQGDLFLLKGAVVIATAAELYGQLQDRLGTSSLPEVVTLDCSEMEAADSAAIGVLLEAHRVLSEAGKTLHVRGLSEDLIVLVKIYGVEWILDSNRSPSAVSPTPGPG